MAKLLTIIQSIKDILVNLNLYIFKIDVIGECITKRKNEFVIFFFGVRFYLKKVLICILCHNCPITTDNG